VRILVTGGAGFIGSHVVDKLIDAGHEPRIFDLRPSPHHSDSVVEQVSGDVTDREALSAAARGCDAIIHLAAVADVGDVVKAPAQAERFNAQGTFEVLEVARQEGIQRVVYGSTTWVYSDCDPDQVDEETPLRPPSHLYTATKLAGELYCKSYSELYGVEYTILRFGIPYGPRARDATVMAAFAAKAEAGEPLTVAGDGSQSRRFVYVEDLAEGVVAGLRSEAANRIYNLARDEEVTILEIAEAVRSQVADTGITHTPSRAADFGGKEVSSRRAAEELGWSAGTPFVEGLGKYIDWRRTRSPSRRVLVLTADIGEGHDLPARAIARDLASEQTGVRVDVVDGLKAMGKLLTLVVRDGSWVSFNWLPWLFELQYFLAARFAPTRWLTLKLGCLLGSRGLRRTIREHDPDVVVSTYPGTTAVLGELRRRGRLETPIVSAITDLAGLRFWAHPGVDLHTVTHRESIEEVERIAGPGSARWARPPTADEFLEPVSQIDARRRLGLPEDGALVVVSGGGWGIGDVSGAVEAALEIEGSTVLCLTGHNQRARDRVERRFESNPRVRVLGFTDQMSELLAAADALVHSTAGLTVLEAQIRGCPVISYGFAVGHIRANNRAYERFGLASVASSPDSLRSALGRALAHRPDPDPAFAALPSVAALALEAEPRPRPRTVPRGRALRAAAATACTFLFAWELLLTDDAYPLFAKVLNASPMTAVTTNQREVGILIDAPSGSVAGIAHQLSRRRLYASFALSTAPSPQALMALRRMGDDALPRLDSGGPFHSLGTKGRLINSATALGLGKGFMYEPGNDFTPTQYLLARAAGGSPVLGAAEGGPGGRLPAVHRGEIIQVSVDGSSASWTATLDALRSRLASSGLDAVTLPTLVSSGSD
jgi:UDP-glucose 4-epimerase